MVSYQYCSYSYDIKINLCRFIFWYCTLIYDNSIIFIMFYFKPSRNIAFITNLESVPLWYFRTQFFAAIQINPQPSNFQSSTTQCNHWKTGIYRESSGSGEVDRDSDINRLASDNLWWYTTVPNQWEWLPWTWTWLLLYFYHWYHYKKRRGRV